MKTRLLSILMMLALAVMASAETIYVYSNGVTLKGESYPDGTYIYRGGAANPTNPNCEFFMYYPCLMYFVPSSGYTVPDVTELPVLNEGALDKIEPKFCDGENAISYSVTEDVYVYVERLYQLNLPEGLTGVASRNVVVKNNKTYAKKDVEIELQPKSGAVTGGVDILKITPSNYWGYTYPEKAEYVKSNAEGKIAITLKEYEIYSENTAIERYEFDLYKNCYVINGDYTIVVDNAIRLDGEYYLSQGSEVKLSMWGQYPSHLRPGDIKVTTGGTEKQYKLDASNDIVVDDKGTKYQMPNSDILITLESLSTMNKDYYDTCVEKGETTYDGYALSYASVIIGDYIAHFETDKYGKDALCIDGLTEEALAKEYLCIRGYTAFDGYGHSSDNGMALTRLCALPEDLGKLKYIVIKVSPEDMKSDVFSSYTKEDVEYPVFYFGTKYQDNSKFSDVTIPDNLFTFTFNTEEEYYSAIPAGTFTKVLTEGNYLDDYVITVKSENDKYGNEYEIIMDFEMCSATINLTSLKNGVFHLPASETIDFTDLEETNTSTNKALKAYQDNVKVSVTGLRSSSSDVKVDVLYSESINDVSLDGLKTTENATLIMTKVLEDEIDNTLYSKLNSFGTVIAPENSRELVSNYLTEGQQGPSTKFVSIESLTGGSNDSGEIQYDEETGVLTVDVTTSQALKDIAEFIASNSNMIKKANINIKANITIEGSLTLGTAASPLMGTINGGSYTVTAEGISLNIGKDGVLEDIALDGGRVEIGNSQKSDDSELKASGKDYYAIYGAMMEGAIKNAILKGSLSVDDASYDVSKIVACMFAVAGVDAKIENVVFYFDEDTKKALKAQTVIMQNVGIGRHAGETAKSCSNSRRGNKAAYVRQEYDEDEINQNYREYSDEEMASGEPSYWLNYTGKGYTGDYTSKWSKGPEHPILATKMSKPVLKMTYQIDGATLAEAGITEPTFFANDGDEIEFSVATAPTKVWIGEMDGGNYTMTSARRITKKLISGASVNGIVTIHVQYDKPTDVEASEVKADVEISVEGKSIMIKNGENAELTVTDMKGREVTRGVMSSSLKTILVPTAGIYVVKVGDKTQKVVIR